MNDGEVAGVEEEDQSYAKGLLEWWDGRGTAYFGG